MPTKLIYRNTTLYNAVMRLLYRRHYDARHRMVADLIPAGSSVVDLCCGSAELYHRYLRDKSVNYTGLDASPFFVDALTKRGGAGLVWNLHSDKSLPRADYVVMQGGLCFFMGVSSALIERMLAAAGERVIILEPIRNLSMSKIPLLARIATRLSGDVSGNHPSRFTEQTLDQLFDKYPPEAKQSVKIPGGRDKLYVLDKSLLAPFFKNR